MKFSASNSGLSFAGSTSNTSKAAPATWPEFSAASKASSSTRPPRAQLIMRTPFFILFRASAEMMLRVESVKGVCRLIKSARATSSSNSTFSMPRVLARSSVRKGSYPITFIFRPCARSATIAPILPQPIMPRRLPVISVPINLDFSHLLAVVEACACGICRASANSIEIACSAVVTALPNGVFMTTTPASVAAAKSTLSTPMPARPTTFNLSARANNSGVTLVAERIARPS